MALFKEEARLVARLVPAGAIVVVGSEAPRNKDADGGAELARVSLGGKQILVFTQDLSAKAKLEVVTALSARGGASDDTDRRRRAGRVEVPGSGG